MAGEDAEALGHYGRGAAGMGILGSAVRDAKFLPLESVVEIQIPEIYVYVPIGFVRNS